MQIKWSQCYKHNKNNEYKYICSNNFDIAEITTHFASLKLSSSGFRLQNARSNVRILN